MNWKILAKGMCMGIADIIPGVSGGTMALILGIYARFITAIRSLNPLCVVTVLVWILSGFRREQWQKVRQSFAAMDLPFLLPLAAGIFSAMALGSAVIPTLMDRYPEVMRGLFFGLILASVGVPWRMMPRENARSLVAGLAAALLCGTFGFTVTDPNRSIDTTATWITIEAPASSKETLKDLIRRGPGSLNAAEIYWAERNAPLRAAHARQDPAKARELARQHEEAGRIAKTNKKARKKEARPYEDLIIADVAVQVPRPAFWFVYVAGVIAISAMVLPGISGSFILLILGCYYFVLNAAKGALTGLVHLHLAPAPCAALALFALGCLTGLVLFSRVLSWLLREFPSLTFGALIGLMVGCLRGVWPWRYLDAQGRVINDLPETLAGNNWHALAALVLGAAAALLLEALGSRRATSH